LLFQFNSFIIISSMKRTLITLAAIALAGIAAHSQETAAPEFKPSGKLDGRLFAHYYNSLEGVDPTVSGFQMERAYLGYTYQVAPEWTARVLLDIGDKNDLNRYAFYKNAAFFYSKNDLKIGFGIQNTQSMTVQEKVWNRRYVFKAYIDENKLGHTADLGITAQYKLGQITIDGAIFNGEGYKKVQSDNTYRAALGMTASLMDEKLLVRVGDEYETKGNAQNLLTLFAGYQGDKLTGGIEYNRQTNVAHVEDNTTGGVSAFAAFAVSDKVALFARVDQIEKEISQVTTTDYTVLGGMEYTFSKNLRGALNVHRYEYDGGTATMFGYASFDVKF